MILEITVFVLAISNILNLFSITKLERKTNALYLMIEFHNRLFVSLEENETLSKEEIDKAIKENIKVMDLK